MWVSQNTEANRKIARKNRRPAQAVLGVKPGSSMGRMMFAPPGAQGRNMEMVPPQDRIALR